MTMRITFKDQQLLSVMRGNARASTTELAKILGVSPHDLIVELAALRVTDLDKMIDEIIAIKGVERTVSSVILSTRLKR